MSIAATPKVIRIAAATASGLAAVMSVVPEASENATPITDAPDINPRLRDRLSSPDMTPR